MKKEELDGLDPKKTQHAADVQVLIGEIGQARMELARLKVAYYAVRAGIEISYQVKGATSGSKEQRLHAINRLITATQENVRVLQVMYTDIADGEPIPEPSGLTVVTGQGK